MKEIKCPMENCSLNENKICIKSIVPYTEECNLNMEEKNDNNK